jgi:hypothetical protein
MKKGREKEGKDESKKKKRGGGLKEMWVKMGKQMLRRITELMSKYR